MSCLPKQIHHKAITNDPVKGSLSNEAAISTDACKDEPPKDDSKWDFVRKGICCMCCQHNVDSLLYRYTGSSLVYIPFTQVRTHVHLFKCAEKLVQGKEKCPVCRAPVVEVVQAYSVQE